MEILGYTYDGACYCSDHLPVDAEDVYPMFDTSDDFQHGGAYCEDCKEELVENIDSYEINEDKYEVLASRVYNNFPHKDLFYPTLNNCFKINLRQFGTSERYATVYLYTGQGWHSLDTADEIMRRIAQEIEDNGSGQELDSWLVETGYKGSEQEETMKLAHAYSKELADIMREFLGDVNFQSWLD